jgi:hypothetical protein
VDSEVRDEIIVSTDYVGKSKKAPLKRAGRQGPKKVTTEKVTAGKVTREGSILKFFSPANKQLRS